MKISLPFKTIFMRYYLTVEKHKTFYCRLNSTSKLTQWIIRQISTEVHMASTSWHLTLFQPTQHSFTLWWNHISIWRNISDAKADEWSPEGSQQRWVGMAGSNTNESADDKQSNISALPACCKKASVSKNVEDHLRTPEREKFG